MLKYLIGISLILALASCKKNESGKEQTLPSLDSIVRSNIVVSDSIATITCSIVSDGNSTVTEKGVCWSLFENPTVLNDHTGNKHASNTGSSLVSNSPGNSFTTVIHGLFPNTAYYLRSYATNNVGTSYSAQTYFITTSSDTGTVVDIDGNHYHEVQIGTQVWLQENLRVTHFRDGSIIKKGLVDLSIPAYGSHPDPVNDFRFGKYYNGYVYANYITVAPEGWHIANGTDFSTLETYLGGNHVAAGKMKAISPLLDSPNVGATNSSHFNGLPAGNMGGDYLPQIGQQAFFWDSFNTYPNVGSFFGLDATTGEVHRATILMDYGLSIRCVKD